jgi:hypothetical protein
MTSAIWVCWQVNPSANAGGLQLSQLLFSYPALDSEKNAMARGAGSVRVRPVREDGGETANVYESDLKFENDDEFEGLRSDKKKLLEDVLPHAEAIGDGEKGDDRAR